MIALHDACIIYIMCVWKKKGESYDPMSTVPTAKHDAGNIVLCGCFSSQGIGNHVMGYDVSTTMFNGWRSVRRIVAFSFLPPYAHHICYIYIIQWDHAYTMLMGCFPSQGTGKSVRIQKIMRKEKYTQIFDENLKESLTRRLLKLSLGDYWKLQQDNDSKRTAKVVQKPFKENDMSILGWHTRSPDLNIIENLWQDLKARMLAMKPTSLTQLESVA